jgi:hypothetical protein
MHWYLVNDHQQQWQGLSPQLQTESQIPNNYPYARVINCISLPRRYFNLVFSGRNIDAFIIIIIWHDIRVTGLLGSIFDHDIVNAYRNIGTELQTLSILCKLLGLFSVDESTMEEMVEG